MASINVAISSYRSLIIAGIDVTSSIPTTSEAFIEETQENDGSRIVNSVMGGGVVIYTTSSSLGTLNITLNRNGNFFELEKVCLACLQQGILTSDPGSSTGYFTSQLIDIMNVQYIFKACSWNTKPFPDGETGVFGIKFLSKQLIGYPN